MMRLTRGLGRGVARFVSPLYAPSNIAFGLAEALRKFLKTAESYFTAIAHFSPPPTPLPTSLSAPGLLCHMRPYCHHHSSFLSALFSTDLVPRTRRICGQRGCLRPAPHMIVVGAYRPQPLRYHGHWRCITG